MHALVRCLCVCACAYELMRAPAVEKLRDHGRIARGTFNAERTTIQPCVYMRNLICQLSEAFNENCITRAVCLCVVCECVFAAAIYSKTKRHAKRLRVICLRPHVCVHAGCPNGRPAGS